MKSFLTFLLLVLCFPAFAQLTPSPNNVTGGLNSVPNVTLATGTLPVANGGTGQALTSKAKLASSIIAALPRNNIKVDPLGDSETAGSNSISNGVNIFNVGTDYIGQPIAASGGRFSYIANDGVAGQTCAQVLARVPTVISHNPNVVPFLSGTNDLAAIAASTETYGQFMNCEEQIVTQLLDAGILPILSTTYPNNTNPLVAKRLQWFEYQLANYYGIPLIDQYKALVDPTAASGTGGKYLAAYSSDGTHLNKTGVMRVYPIVSAVLSNLAQEQSYPYLGSVDEDASPPVEISNLVRNGVFFQSAPPSPDYWTLNAVQGSYSSAAAVYPFSGYSLTYLHTGAAAYMLNGTGPTVASGAISIGDTVYAAIRCNASGLVPATSGGWQMESVATGGSADLEYLSPFNGDVTFASYMIVPASTTSITPDVYIADTSGAGTFTCNNFTIVDATKENALWQPGQQGL